MTSAMAAGQIAFILTPPVAMALLLTSSPRRTLRLYWPETRYLGLAVGLALSLNPLVTLLHVAVQYLFPMSQDLQSAVEKLMAGATDLPTTLLFFAVIPAVCEEFAFRGFILTGLERGHSTRTAILMSALLFGILHVLLSLFQQLFNATLLGIVLGLLAVRSRSIVPGIVFHLIHNGLAVAMGTWVTSETGRRFAPWLYRDPSRGLYHWWLVVVGLLVSVFLFNRLRQSGGTPDPVAEAHPDRPSPAPIPHAG
jgi:sodium transport system permease protein